MPVEHDARNAWPKRLYAMDVSRGVAAFCVVLWHWQHFAYDGVKPQADYSRAVQPFYSVLKPFYEHGYLGVYYFFVLSGFIFFWLYRQSIHDGTVTLKKFWVQRFSRLYPLHIAALLLVAVLQGIYISQENHAFVYPNNDTYHFGLQLFFASNWGLEDGWSFNGPIWSVSIEVLLYMVFFAVALASRANIIQCITILLVACVAWVMWRHLILKGAAMFFLGGVAFHVVELIKNDRPSVRKAVYSLTIIAWLLLFAQVYWIDVLNVLNLGDTLTSYISMAFPSMVVFPLTVCALACLGYNNGTWLKPWAWIGDMSYSSYLLHFPMQLLVMLCVSHGLLHSGFYRHPVSLVLFIIMLAVISRVTYCRFERPMQQWVRAKLS